ncbi:MAG: sigma-54-dependent Fis family transcriptional regulator [Candidatus Delongbacteria bacterium]|nr:sigma-54-dependent Fis family transcriptional regulator [bacterium]MBL7032544.1 sigma-54-dependent Fis family transcriptional regulator [Candidatus Delongbacteria bacterium]
MARILVIDDDKAACRTLELFFQEAGHEVLTAGTAASGMETWRKSNPSVVLLDLMLPDGYGLDLLTEASQQGLPGVVIMITGHQDLDLTIQGMRSGAWDYIHKPLNIDELEQAVMSALALENNTENPALVVDLLAEIHPEKIVGCSRALVEIHKKIGLTSRGQANVLITGDSGTGKELVARAIHRYTCPLEPLVAVNCSAFVPTLLESELFGHEKGAFTGADRKKQGRFELAGSGTLFLDEIGDLDHALQVKLLRVLQEKVFERVGGTEEVEFKARVIAATNRDLESLVAAGSFREDLLFRLKVIEIDLPPLRERREDIPPLTEHLLLKINRELKREVTEVAPAVLQRLQNYDWPGNVRELENRLTAAVMLSNGKSLDIDLPQPEGAAEPPPSSSSDWQSSLAQVESRHIAGVLKACGWNLGKTCDILGITRPTLRRKIEEYSLTRD